MKTSTAFNPLRVAALLGVFATPLQAWEPNAQELDAAISSGNFSGYLSKITPWLNRKSPATPDENSLTALLNVPVFRMVLDQHQLITKTGADQLGAFAKASPTNQTFLKSLLRNAPAMDLYLEGSVPISLAKREEHKWSLNPASLGIWQKILLADPEAKDGIYQKMAIAIAILPPGSINIGAGGAATPADPLVRYNYYKTAHKNQELFPSFDHLTVWEYSKILCSGAADADLTWAREMINNFRPDLRADELVVNSTSLVWRRGAPPQFYPNGGYQNFKNVIAGGGKCGPRSSWSVMVCHAFGIPAIGVGQPGHACVAYKAANPMTEPQPGSAWKVGYGVGWDKSTLEATKGESLKGPVFLEGIEKRADAAKFSQVEHLRWFASILSEASKADAIMTVARKINDSIVTAKTEEAEADPRSKAVSKGLQPKLSAPTNRPPPAGKGLSGVIQVEAASFVKTGGKISWGGQFPNVLVHDSFGGGKQVYFQQQMNEQWADYTLDIPAAGVYQIVMQTTCINEDQLLEVWESAGLLAAVNIAPTFGVWQQTAPVELTLAKGKQTLRIQTPVSVNCENHKRGIALKGFQLKAK